MCPKSKFEESLKVSSRAFSKFGKYGIALIFIGAMAAILNFTKAREGTTRDSLILDLRYLPSSFLKFSAILIIFTI